MRGIDPNWRDVEQVLIGVTQEIWKDRHIGSQCHRHAPELILRLPASVAIHTSQVIAATAATLAEFRDRKLLGEDVIWCDVIDRTRALVAREGGPGACATPMTPAAHVQSPYHGAAPKSHGAACWPTSCRASGRLTWM